jgi:hypothetical protein
LFQKFNFPFVLLPHELEGSLGHATAVAAAAFASPPCPIVVSLDVGGGSFQVDVHSQAPSPPYMCMKKLHA